MGGHAGALARLAFNFEGGDDGVTTPGSWGVLSGALASFRGGRPMPQGGWGAVIPRPYPYLAGKAVGHPQVGKKGGVWVETVFGLRTSSPSQTPPPRGCDGVRWGRWDANLPPKHSLSVNMPMRRRCATRGGEAQNGSLRRLRLGQKVAYYLSGERGLLVMGDPKAVCSFFFCFISSFFLLC